jgi:TldD protein
MRVCLLLSAIAALAAHAQTAKPAPLLASMKAELVRSMEHLKTQQIPPYFLSYELIEIEGAGATGSFGSLLSSNRGSRRRMLSIDLRVGDYKLDNTHPIRGSGMNMLDNFSSYPMPVDDDADAIRGLLWYYTDIKYKRAVEQRAISPAACPEKSTGPV